MLDANRKDLVLGIVGAGLMGRGIAQIAALAGIEVLMFDLRAGAAEEAKAALEQTLSMLVDKGKLSADERAAAAGRIVPAAALGEFARCHVVVEAIIEKLDAKRDLFRQLEGVVGDDCLLASNTSSLAVTSIAAACRLPERVAGFHFFSPVPLMKIVEVIEGVLSAPWVGETLTALARRMGHTPVRAKDTPGFIVNHAGRGFLTEALRIVGEGVADFATVDRVLRAAAGFRLGPFELLDLTGLDVSHPVMESIYRQFYDEVRFRPTVITAQRMAAGLLGRKTGEGFYRYVDGKAESPAEAPVPSPAVLPPVWVAPGPRQAMVAETAAGLGAAIETGIEPSAGALVLVAPLGLDATAAAAGLPAERVVAIDTLFPIATGACQRRVLMTNPATTAPWRDAAHALFAADGARVSVLRDSPGFIAQRVVAMIVSVATEIAQQRIASPADIDTAVRIGLGYPRGPLTMGDMLGASTILEILANMHRLTGDPRYRPSAWLRRRAQLGLSLLQDD